MTSVLAAQLYTLRDFTKTPADIASTMKRVKKMGYDAVQCSALGPIDPKELGNILKGENLTCCATHASFEKMRDQTQAFIDEQKTIGCEYPAIGSMPGSYPRTKDGYQRFAKDASEVARKLKAAGLTFGYHNHSFEFEKFDGRTGMQILIEESDKEAVTFEVDTYWVQHGGADPAAVIKGLKGRIPLVHLKDMVVAENRTAAMNLKRNEGENDEAFKKRQDAAGSRQPIMAEVGEGNMNFPAILEACKSSGTKWYIVEQDVCQRDPFESLAISLKNLRALGLK